MDQLDYASKMAKCKETFASNPLNVAQLESKTPQQRDLYIQERCRERINVQVEKEKTQSQQNNQVETDKNKLPTSKDPTLVKKQADAEIQKKKGELENKLQQEKEKKVEELKNKIATLKGLAMGGFGLFPKLPMVDPKIIATLQFLKAQKESIEAKQKESKQNVAKAKENFTFPMKPVNQPETTPSASISSQPVPTKPSTTLTPTPTPTRPVVNTRPRTNYYVEIREQKNAWVAEVYLANPRSFQDTKFYSKSKYQTRQDAINQITNDVKSSGLAGLPPEPGFTFPGTRT